MSKFQKGDRVKYKKTVDGSWCAGTVLRIEGNEVWCDWDDGWHNIHMPEDKLLFADDRMQPKPAKKHTESDRRKAAKAVRVAEKKLKDAIKRATSVCINVDMDLAINDITINMSFQPATPKKRVYK